MPELFRARGGGYAGTFVGSGGGVCRNYCGLRGGGMPELFRA